MKLVLYLLCTLYCDALAFALWLFRSSSFFWLCRFYLCYWFCLDNLLELRKLLPGQHAQFLIENEWRDEIYDVLKENRFDLDIDRVLITKEIIDRVHALGQEVNCWTVNTAEEGEKLAEWGVDYITTNILE